MRSVAQWLRRFITKPTVVGSILADDTTFTGFVPFSKALKPNCLLPTHGYAEAFILQWIDTAWDLFYLFAHIRVCTTNQTRTFQVRRWQSCKHLIHTCRG